MAFRRCRAVSSGELVCLVAGKARGFGRDGAIAGDVGNRVDRSAGITEKRRTGNTTTVVVSISISIPIDCCRPAGKMVGWVAFVNNKQEHREKRKERKKKSRTENLYQCETKNEETVGYYPKMEMEIDVEIGTYRLSSIIQNGASDVLSVRVVSVCVCVHFFPTFSFSFTFFSLLP